MDTTKQTKRAEKLLNWDDDDFLFPSAPASAVNPALKKASARPLSDIEMMLTKREVFTSAFDLDTHPNDNSNAYCGAPNAVVPTQAEEKQSRKSQGTLTVDGLFADDSDSGDAPIPAPLDKRAYEEEDLPKAKANFSNFFVGATKPTVPLFVIPPKVEVEPDVAPSTPTTTGTPAASIPTSSEERERDVSSQEAGEVALPDIFYQRKLVAKTEANTDSFFPDGVAPPSVPSVTQNVIGQKGPKKSYLPTFDSDDDESISEDADVVLSPSVSSDKGLNFDAIFSSAGRGAAQKVIDIFALSPAATTLVSDSVPTTVFAPASSSSEPAQELLDEDPFAPLLTRPATDTDTCLSDSTDTALTPNPTIVGAENCSVTTQPSYITSQSSIELYDTNNAKANTPTDTPTDTNTRTGTKYLTETYTDDEAGAQCPQTPILPAVADTAADSSFERSGIEDLPDTPLSHSRSGSSPSTVSPLISSPASSKINIDNLFPALSKPSDAGSLFSKPQTSSPIGDDFFTPMRPCKPSSTSTYTLSTSPTLLEASSKLPAFDSFFSSPSAAADSFFSPPTTNMSQQNTKTNLAVETFLDEDKDELSHLSSISPAASTQSNDKAEEKDDGLDSFFDQKRSGESTVFLDYSARALNPSAGSTVEGVVETGTVSPEPSQESEQITEAPEYKWASLLQEFVPPEGSSSSIQ